MINTKKLPYIELHCHLDGSVRSETILDIAKKENISLPTFAIEEIKNKLIAPLDCKSLIEYLSRFDIPNMVMQSKESLERITFEVYEDAAKENVKYMEVRFAPYLHTKKNLSLKEIISSVVRGMKKAETQYNIKGNIILCCMRTMSEEKALDIIDAGKDFIGKGIVAIDLAGPEEAEFAYKYKNAFKIGRNYGYKVTIHAGEAGIGKNVLEAIEILGAERIGHGVYIKDCPEAYNLVKSKNIALEMCPTSNVQTKAVNNFKEHPIHNFLKDNLIATVSTDNRTVSNTNMNKEFKILKNTFSLTNDEYRKIYYNSVDAAFCDGNTKKILKKLL